MKSQTTTRVLTLAACLAIAGILLGGAIFYKVQERTLRRTVESQLESIAEVKVSQVRQWREERLREAQAVAEGAHFKAAVRRVILNGHPEKEPAMQEHLHALERIFGYKDISFVDAAGRVCYRLSGTRMVFPSDMHPYLDQAMQSGHPIMSELHMGLQDSKPHVDVIAPLREDNTSPACFGLLVLRVDATQSLFPLIQSWPVPSGSAETLLVRREGERVLFLNELRHKKDSAMKLSLPLSNLDIPAVAAVLGRDGVFFGRDYRGVSVLAAKKRVPGTDWWMVAKVDTAEAFAGWQGFSRLILGLIVGLVATTAALAGMLVQRQRRTHLEKQLQAESALAREREQLAVTLRSIGDGVITTDTRGQVVLMNKVAEQLTGWSHKEALGHPLPEVFRIVQEYTGEPCENPAEKVLRTGCVVELANHAMLLSRDKRTYAIADCGAPILDSGNTIIGVVLVFRDVTEKRKMEESIRHSQKLDALGVLAGGIAHDFNNLLSGIFGFLDLGRDQVQQRQPEKALKSIDKALEVFERTKGLTRQLLTFAKGGAPQRKSQFLQPILLESARFALAGSTISCEFDLAEDLKPCEIDEHQIAQVVSNLVLNAKEAMPSGGLVRIAARNILLHPGERPPLPGGAFVEVLFQDSGEGIPPEILSRIFDPFFSTKQQGSGLGLAMVHSILHRHGGAIVVESIQGKGSLFRLFLPISEQASVLPEAPSSVFQRGSGRILIMDDEAFVRQIATETLQGLGYETMVAEEGSEAIELFSEAREQGVPFSLIILDLTVPGGMGGLETAKHLREIDPKVRLVVSSGYSSDPIMCDPEAHGFLARINKPYLRSELADTVARCLLISEASISVPR